MKKEQFHFQNICKRLGRLTILNRIDLRLYKGEIAFLLGISGCGKTALAQIASGQLQPDEGRLLLNEKLVVLRSYDIAVRRGIQYFSAQSKLVENLTIGENITLCERRFPHELRLAQASNLLAADFCKELGLDLDVSKSAWGLSTMEALTILVARSLYQCSTILFFDGVLTALSAEERQQFLALLRLLSKHSVSTLLMESTVAEITRQADRILFLSRGSIIFDSPQDEVDCAVFLQ